MKLGILLIQLKSGMEKLKIFSDDRGDLLPIEFSNVSFIPKRIFTIYNVPKNTIRGEHSHYETTQLLICQSGKIEVYLHDGTFKYKKILYKGDQILIDKLIWGSQKFLTKNSNLLVLCSTNYDINDYILNFDDFLKIKNNLK